jgi:uncharacterized protein (DUF302 family)
VSVWQDERGRVWAGHRSVEGLAAEYGIEDIVAKAVNVYDYSAAK